MNAHPVQRSYLLSFLILATGILSLEWWIAHSIEFLPHPELISFAITFDITLFIPLLFYFLVVRRKHFSVLTLLPVFISTVLFANFVLPATYHFYVNIEKKILALLEIVLFLFVLSRMRLVLRNFKLAKLNNIFFCDILAESLVRTFWNYSVFAILSTEFCAVYYALFGWFQKFRAANFQGLTFSYHRKAAYGAILGVLSLLLLVETVGLHLIVSHWSVLIAWIFTILSIYTFLWLMGDYHAIRLQPVLLDESSLYFRIGFRWRARIRLEDIAEIKFSEEFKSKPKGYLRASILWPRVILCLKSPVIVFGMMGIKRETKFIALSIDDRESFRDELNKRLTREM